MRIYHCTYIVTNSVFESTRLQSRAHSRHAVHPKYVCCVCVSAHEIHARAVTHYFVYFDSTLFVHAARESEEKIISAAKWSSRWMRCCYNPMPFVVPNELAMDALHLHLIFTLSTPSMDAYTFRTAPRMLPTKQQNKK